MASGTDSAPPERTLILLHKSLEAAPIHAELRKSRKYNIRCEIISWFPLRSTVFIHHFII